jgi:hypothetical protein
LGLLAVLAVLLGACQFLRPQAAPVPDAQMWLAAGNGSDRKLVLFVNDLPIRDVLPGTETRFTAAELPPLPWHAELRLETGRTLVELVLASGTIMRSSDGGGTGAGARMDLSCGRVELYSGFPMGGPPPGGGVPGDCNP